MVEPSQIRSILMDAGIDYDSALRRMMGKESLYYRFLKKFADDPNYRDFQDGLREKDPEKAFRAAHTLKGLGANLGMDELTRAVSGAVEILRPLSSHGRDSQAGASHAPGVQAMEISGAENGAGDWTQAVKTSSDQIREAYERIIGALKASGIGADL